MRSLDAWIIVVTLAALSLQVRDAHAFQTVDRVGDASTIRLEQTSETSGDGSSGSSRSAYTLLERVVAVREDGIELEYDLPEGTSAEDRLREWRLPARVLRSEDGALRLLNTGELETRLQTWLDRAGITDSACGRWIFTWTAIKIECEPLSVLETLADYDLRQGRAQDGVAPVDPDQVRRELAEADVVVAEIMGQALTIDDAVRARASLTVSGATTTSSQSDEAGRIIRRTYVTELQLVSEDGSTERRTTTTTAQRSQ